MSPDRATSLKALVLLHLRGVEMADDHRLVCCPGCGAPLMLRVEAGDEADDGFVICEHGHIFDLDDPDDDRALRAAMGADYRRQLVEYGPLH